MTPAYTRHVSDYSISAHETFCTVTGDMPKHSYIGYIVDIPSPESKNALLESIVSKIQEHGYSDVATRDMFYDETLFDQVSEYTVYYQKVSLMKAADKHLALEIFEKKKETCVIILSDSPDTFEDVKGIIENFRKNTPKPKKEKTFYTIGQSSHGFQLEELTIKSEIDPDVIATNYEDDFPSVNATMEELITTDKRGLVLFHGDPGTGKTTYIKKLINSGYDRKVVYIPPHLANSIADPSFVSFVREELSNSVLVIEDAEDILRSREGNGQATAVSNLLNITDGILGEAYNVLIVCTFNSEESFIDKALVRKGRLKLKYEFKRLPYAKALVLAKKIHGDDVVLDVKKEGYSVADIYNLDYEPLKQPERPKVSFGFSQS